MKILKIWNTKNMRVYWRLITNKKFQELLNEEIVVGSVIPIYTRIYKISSKQLLIEEKILIVER